MSKTEEFRIKKKINAFRCLRCNHEWIPRVELSQLEGFIKQTPRICPKCKSPYWDTKRGSKRK